MGLWPCGNFADLGALHSLRSKRGAREKVSKTRVREQTRTSIITGPTRKRTLGEGLGEESRDSVEMHGVKFRWG